MTSSLETPRQQQQFESQP